MVHGSINNEEDEMMLPRRENTWEKAQKISSYGNSRHVSGLGLLVADFIVSTVLISMSLISKKDQCDQPLHVFLEVASFLQFFLDILSVCLYVEKVNVSKGKLDAVAGLLCAQNCCVLPIVFALYAWYVYGLLSLSQAGVCSQRLKHSLCISAAWFFLYSLYQLCNLWSTEKADKAEFFNRINREQPEGVPFSLQAELSWNTEVEDWI